MSENYHLLARTGTRVRVGGRSFHLPFHPAGKWVSETDRLDVLVSRLAEPDDHAAMVAMVEQDVPGVRDDLKKESQRVLEEATGRRWWEAGRLISTSVGTEVLGRMVLSGADPWARSIGEWVAAAYALCVKGQDEKGRIRFDFMLSVPPLGYEDAWDDEGEDPEAAQAAVQAMLGR